MAEFTTGEAVALELPIARIPTRATAFLLDVLVQFALAAVLFTGVAIVLASSGADTAWLSVAVVVVVVTVLVGYPVTWETLLRGRTPGKAALGLRVVRTDGGPIDFRHAITRGLAGAIIDFWVFGAFGAVAVISSMSSPTARRVGDVVAGTVVVHAQQPLPVPALAIIPPWLAGWAAQLELNGLPEDLALSVRQYLTRHRTLTPAVQANLGAALVRAVCDRLQVLPPAGPPPLQILGAVIGERQRRTLTQPVPSPAIFARPGAAPVVPFRKVS